MALLYANQYFSTRLSTPGGIDNSQTTGITLQSISGVDHTKPGAICITYAEPLVTTTAEYVTYTSINNVTNELNGAVRGAEGYSAKAHSEQATVAFIVTESHINQFSSMFDTTGLDIAQLTTPANPAASRNKLYFKSDDNLYKLTSAGVESAVGSVTTAVGVRATRTTAQSIATATETAIDFTSEDFDTDGFHDTGVNPSRLTVPSGKGGKYIIVATANFAANGTGRRTLILKKNGTSFAQTEWANSSSNVPYMNLTAINSLVATDYIEAVVFQTSGGSLNVDTYLSCSMMYMGA